MIFFGVNILVNSVNFIQKITSKKSTENHALYDEKGYGFIKLQKPKSATNSATILVSGNISEFNEVDYMINNVKVGSSNIKLDSFEKEIGPLKKGENRVYVVAKKGDETKKSETYVVYYKNEPIKIDIESPLQDMKTNEKELPIKGNISPGSTLKVNTQPIVVDTAGFFDSKYILKDGQNNLEFFAEDIAGNTKEINIIVFYEKKED